MPQVTQTGYVPLDSTVSMSCSRSSY